MWTNTRCWPSAPWIKAGGRRATTAEKRKVFGLRPVALAILWLLILTYAFGVYRQLPKLSADYTERDYVSYYRGAHDLLEGINP